MSSNTLTQLVNFLTCPLILTHSAISVSHLQLALQASFSSFIPLSNNGEVSPFTIHLSPRSLPITPVYAACLRAGVSWDSWIAALSGGNDIYVFVMQGCIRVGSPGNQEIVTVWTEDAEPQSVSSRTRSEGPSPMATKLQAMLESARTRRENQNQKSLSESSLTAISVTPSTSVPTSAPTHASEPDPDSDPDCDSDSDSDTESTTSSTFSSRSVESMTSVSSISSVASAASSGCSNAFGKPFSALPVPSRAQRRREWVSTQRKTTNVVVNVNKSKTDVMKYTYQGGQTGVMTGGVMLGGVSPSKAKMSSPKRKTAGTDSGDWRRRV